MTELSVLADIILGWGTASAMAYLFIISGHRRKENKKPILWKEKRLVHRKY